MLLLCVIGDLGLLRFSSKLRLFVTTEPFAGECSIIFDNGEIMAPLASIGTKSIAVIFVTILWFTVASLYGP